MKWGAGAVTLNSKMEASYGEEKSKKIEGFWVPGNVDLP